AVIDIVVVGRDGAADQAVLIALADIVIGVGRVVDALDGDGQGRGVAVAMLVGDGVADDDVLARPGGEVLIGVIAGVELPAAVGIERQAGGGRGGEGPVGDRAGLSLR